ncbi:MAG: TonB-dependent receptor [Ignavibacteriae bacterium]|nr:TonB-dependent receptor [Ignavibacteriota bacterium]
MTLNVRIFLSIKRVCNLFVLLLFTTVFLPVSQLHSGTTGKIAGVVRDAATGEPIPGCNIVIVGSTIGAASDINGQYFIINITPGKYSIKASMVGYRSITVDNVQIIADLTTQIDFNLESASVQLEGDIIVTAERPLVQLDETSKQATVTFDEIVNMPVNSITEILTTKAGFTVDANGDLHVRGGRTSEISYMVDGVKMEDPLYRETNNNFNKDAINQMVIISGTFNAEYGDAMSGIVNITTQDGGTNFKGRVEYTTPTLEGSKYRKANAFPGVQDLYQYKETSVLDEAWIGIPGQLRASLSGPILSDLTFFLSGYSLNKDSYLPHGYNTSIDGFGKLTYFASPTLKFGLSNQFTNTKQQGYSHPWKYRSDHQTHTTTKSNRQILNATHTVNQNLFYTVNLSRFENNALTQVGNKRPEEYTIGRTGESVYFYVDGDDSRYADNKTLTYRGKLDATWQANNYHQFKSGLEIIKHKIDVHEESAPWPSGANFKDIYSKSPAEFSAYIQDKIEYDYLIVNVGIRLDYINPEATMWPDIRRFGEFDQNNNFIPSKEVAVEPQYAFSPRIGLAFPITEQSVLHFAYGHFFQNPNYNALYYNIKKDLSTSLPLIGNPTVKAQKTISFEAGLKHQLGDNWAFDITAWYKDITDLLSTLQVSYLSRDYVIFYNSDYASVKGIDLTLKKRFADYFSGSVDYTYMIAKGNNSQPLGGYLNAYTQEEIPHQEYFLDFDQRHNFAANFSFYVPKDHGILSDLNFNFIFRASSGLPYTPYVDPTVRIDVNSERKPWTSSLDFRLQKQFPVSFFSIAWFWEITNLFNNENVLFVYSRTGKPFDSGEPGLVGSSPDANHNPANVGPPRAITTGIQIIW